MSYQVIARKYRPQRFSDVVGQEHVTQTLAQAISQKRIAHAYIFCGPRGTGKTTVARIFAKCLNCTAGPNANFDVADPKCVEIAEGRSIDVMEIDGASNNGVEQVRELRETVKYSPASSQFKIYIIDEVHMLSTAAFNALLKTLEEPPAHVKFLFATTDPEKVLPTILSRCQRFDLRRIPVPLIVKQLKEICINEKVEAETAALDAIARGCDGGMRDAESALDQLISFCGNKIVESDVLAMYGLTAQSQLLAITNAIMSGDAALALRELDSLAKGGKDLGRLLGDLLRHFRNLLLFQVSKGDLSLIEASETETATLAQQTSSLTTDALTRIMEVLSQCEMNLRDAASKKILIEIAVLKAIQARGSMSLDTVLKQLQQLRTEAPIAAPRPAIPVPAAPVPTTPTPVPVAAPVHAPVPALAKPAPILAPPALAPAPHAPTPTAPAAQVTLSKEELEALWTRLVEAAGRASAFIKSYLLEAHPVSFERNILTIGFDPANRDHRDLVDNSKNHTLIQTKLGELGKHGIMVKFIIADHPADRPRGLIAPTPSADATSSHTGDAPAAPVKEKPKYVEFNPQDYKNDPLIQKALEVFKGTMVRQ
jgi:DNA polymerase-3 subunit gamma/tau